MDYKKLGLKVGLELHQQVCRSKKLFCNCPSVLRQDKPEFTIKRELRPMAGELGKVDVASAYEGTKRLHYIYEGYEDTICEIECDESPPVEVNKEALDAALTIAVLLHCQIPDVIQIMRKTITNGSVCSAFQRTALIGLNGYIKTKNGKIGILSVCLEEDAARRTAEDKKSVTYRLDRQGIALIEVATAPDMHTAEQTKEVAKYLHNILKSTGKTISGIGTIRQDVNINIKGHPRIELKGVQDIRSMLEVIKKEVIRQNLQVKASKRELPHVRNVKPDLTSKYLRPMPGGSRMYVETDHPLISITKQKLADIKKNLPELPDKKLNRLIKAGLNEDLATQVLFDKQFMHLHKKFSKLDQKLIATTLLSTQKEAKKKAGSEQGQFSDEHFNQIFNLLSKGKIAKEAILDILIAVAKAKTVAQAAKKYKLLTKTELKKEIAKLKKQFSKVRKDKLKGIIIGKLRGKAEVREILKSLK